MTNVDQRRTVVMLGGSRLQVPAIMAAQRLGFRVVCADYDPDAVALKSPTSHRLRARSTSKLWKHSLARNRQTS